MSRHPVIDGSTRLLVVAPHPDDESLAAGMLIQRTLAAGGRADVLLLTDGDDNPWPQRWMERRLVIDEAGRARWGARRRGEVASALARLGVGPDHLHALGWHDMRVTEELRLRHTAAVVAIRRVMERTRPSLVVIPDLGDTHPDHGSAHVLARLALAATGSRADVLTYMVHGTERSAPEDLLVPDVDPERQATKIEAVLEHATQMALEPQANARRGRAPRTVRPPAARARQADRCVCRGGRVRWPAPVCAWCWPTGRAWPHGPGARRPWSGQAMAGCCPARRSRPGLRQADRRPFHALDLRSRYGWTGQDPEPFGLVARPVAACRMPLSQGDSTP